MEEIIAKKTSKEIGEENRARVLDCYTEHIERTGKSASITYLAETCNLTRPVIYKHLKNLQLNEIGIKFKPRAITILEGVAKKAEDGDVQAAKLILQIAYGWSEKKAIDIHQTKKSIKVIFNTNDEKQIQKITDNMNTEYEEVEDDNTE